MPQNTSKNRSGFRHRASSILRNFNCLFLPLALLFIPACGNGHAGQDSGIPIAHCMKTDISGKIRIVPGYPDHQDKIAGKSPDTEPLSSITRLAAFSILKFVVSPILENALLTTESVDQSSSVLLASPSKSSETCRP